MLYAQLTVFINTFFTTFTTRSSTVENTAFLLIVKILLALVIVLSFLRYIFSKSVLRGFCEISFKNGYRPFAPNWITAYRIVVALIGFYLYVTDNVLSGAALIALGAALDRVDGKMANAMGKSLSHPSTWKRLTSGSLRAEITGINYPSTTITEIIGKETNSFSRFWIEFNYPGATDLGKVFDSAIDKIQMGVLLVYFSLWAEVLSVWLVAVMFIPEIVGTLIRRPFLPDSRKDWIYQEKASGIGKVKAVSQWIVVLLCVPLEQGWVDDTHWASGYEWVPDAILGFVIIMAFLSVMSRLKYFRNNRSVNQVIESVERAISHQ